jgi:AcrR family transcriptional regulator
MTLGTDKPTRLRRDAQRNRQLLLAAATEVFSEQGLDASLDEIARRAGVGNATLYRRFPTREDLYEALFAEAGDVIRQLGDRALAIEDAWTAFVTYLEGLCEFATTNRPVCDLMLAGFPEPPSVTEGRLRSEATLHELVLRAQRQGSLRTDLTTEDIGVALCSVQLLMPATVPVAPHAWRRHLALILDGLRSQARSTLPASSLTQDQLHEVAAVLFPTLRAHQDKRRPSRR